MNSLATRSQGRFIRQTLLSQFIFDERGQKNNVFEIAFSSVFDNLTDLLYIFDSLDVQKKKTLIEQVFGKGLAFDGMIYRTPYINPLFMSKALILSNKKTT